jgi:hypothetical protein
VSRYRGPATLISGDGAEVEVHVDLRAKQREWSGTATIGDFDATACQRRLKIERVATGGN